MTPVTLPKLRIPTDSEVFGAQQHNQWPHPTVQPQQQQQLQFQSQFQGRVAAFSHEQQQHAAATAKGGPLTRSPSSPAAFFEDPDNKVTDMNYVVMSLNG